MSHKTIDCKDLRCPLPIVQVSRAIKELDSQDTLEIEATDPAFEADIEAWATMTGNVLESFDHGDVLKAVVRKQ